MVSQAPIHSSAVARLRSRRDGATERRLCFLAIGDNGASTLTFHALPSPSAASKFLALLVALVALSTANAQTTLKATLTGVLSSTYTTGAGPVTNETGLSTDLAAMDFTATVSYGAIEAAHIDAPALDSTTSDSGYEWKNFVDYYDSSDAVWKTYVEKAIVSFDFKT